MVAARALAMSYAELHCLSNFSFQRGASHPRELVEQAHQLGYSALALTDECSVAGVVRAYEAARETGFRLIVGSEIQLHDGPKIVLLAATQTGYTHLCRLITVGRRASEKGTYRLGRDDCTELDGIVPIWIPRWPAKGIPEETFEAEISWASDALGNDLRLAWERHLHPDDRQRGEAVRKLGRRFGLRCVAAGDVHYHVRDRQPLQDVMACVKAGCSVRDSGAPLFSNGERHLRRLATLERLYPPLMRAETLAIMEQCTFSLGQLKYEYPHELVPAGRTAIEHLTILTEEGAQRRWPHGVPPSVQTTINRELTLIAELRYEHFFLTVADVVSWSRSQNILCQGRGSAANSAVCFCLGVTEVDPARMNLLFERFISEERGEPPDIDVDFEHQRREEAIQYIFGKYGRDRAALTAVVTSYRTRSAIRDVGKALGLGIEQIEILTKRMSYWDGTNTLAERLGEGVIPMDATVLGQFVHLVKKLVGMPRHLSQHPGGFVISHHALHTLVPVENAAMPDRTIIQWDKDDLDVLGILKVDVLALGMLSAIHRALDLVAKFRGVPFGMLDVPAEDAATYDMIGRAQTIGVFQIESRAQMTVLPRSKPKNYFDLVVQVALIRPGPIQGDMVHPYLRRRQGLEAVSYPSPDIERVLGPTLGVPLFQEQVMSLAIVAAGFSPGEADELRRAMAAWKRNGNLEKFRTRLLNGMRERGYTDDYAEQVYSQILGFSGYGFPQSHAASFALLTYVSCWLKCHEPAAFCAALLNSQPMGFYQPAQLVQEAKRNGKVRFLPVDANLSDYESTLERGIDGRPDVRLGLRLIASLPKDEGQRLVERRNEHYSTADEVANRAELSKRAIDALAEAGALDSIASHRHGARWSAAGVQHLSNVLRDTSIMDTLVALPPPTEAQTVVADYQGLGLTLGRHPVSFLRARLDQKRFRPAAILAELRDGSAVRVAGIVTHRQRPDTASGVVFVTLEDETGWMNLIIWPKVLDAYRQAVMTAKLLSVVGRLQATPEGVLHVIASRIDDASRMLGAIQFGSRDFR